MEELSQRVDSLQEEFRKEQDERKQTYDKHRLHLEHFEHSHNVLQYLTEELYESKTKGNENFTCTYVCWECSYHCKFAKNLCVTRMKESNCEVFVLVDDDTEFKKKDSISTYSRKVWISGMHHLSVSNPKATVKKEYKKNGVTIRKYSLVDGHFLVLTRHAVDKIGCFTMFKGKYGGEHLDVSMRISREYNAPVFVDIPEGNELIGHLGEGVSTAGDEEEREKALAVNRWDLGRGVWVWVGVWGYKG